MRNMLTSDLVGAMEYNTLINQIWKRFQELGQYTGGGLRELDY